MLQRTLCVVRMASAPRACVCRYGERGFGGPFGSFSAVQCAEASIAGPKCRGCAGGPGADLQATRGAATSGGFVWRDVGRRQSVLARF